jgi:hypothetical protein
LIILRILFQAAGIVEWNEGLALQNGVNGATLTRVAEAGEMADGAMECRIMERSGMPECNGDSRHKPAAGNGNR